LLINEIQNSKTRGRMEEGKTTSLLVSLIFDNILGTFFLN